MTAHERLRGWLVHPADGHGVHLATDAGGWALTPYTALADRALRLANILRDKGFSPGDGAAVIMPTAPATVAAFFATWAAGGYFTPIAPPLFEDLDTYRRHLVRILEVAAPAVVVTSPEFADTVAGAMHDCGRTDEPLVVTESLPPAHDSIGELAEPGPICLLQFTSGSTGVPRGVQVGWDNLADNIARITSVIDWRDGDATASWLPLHHDMGLIGALLMTATMQGDLYLMRPDQFVRDPLRWLRAMQHAQHSPSPAFALDYVARRVPRAEIDTLDLSAWRSLVLGSEPVPPAAVLAFAAALAGARFDLAAVTVAYGLAENTLFVTSSPRGRPPTALRIDHGSLHFGAAVAIVERRPLVVGTDIVGAGWLSGVGDAPHVSIVDDKGDPLPDETLGEIRIEGGSVALGYAGPAPTSGSAVRDGVLLTGDAGFRSGGELFVLGRMGTSLKVRGRAVFMEDVEARVAAAVGTAPGKIAAVAVPDRPEPGIVLFVERAAGSWIGDARRVAGACIGSAAGVRVVSGQRGLIQRTSSGKPRRRHMWQALQDGRLAGAVAHPQLILSDDYIAALLADAALQVRIPDECTVLLEGSIAEGFGNDGSDVDFLVVSPGDEAMPTMPTVLFADGRRLEVRTRSVAQLRAQIDLVRSGTAPEDVLNRVQRFLRGYVVRSGSADIESLRSALPHDRFADHMRKWWSGRAVQALRYAVALDALGAGAEATGWARDGLDQAMKSWAAARGETYLESKWLPHQLDRIGSGPTVARYRSAGESLDEILSAAATTGVPDVPNDPACVQLRRMPGVTTWPIGDRIHVLRDRRDVFALADHAGTVWRTAVFGRSVAAIPDPDRAAFAEFVRLGFIGLRWGRGEPILPALAMCNVAGPYTPPPGSAAPALGVLGGHTEPGSVATLSPLAADRFAACALALIWSNIVAENAREDLLGAIKNDQWQVAAVAAHRVIAMGVRVVLSAFGVHPLPADVAPTATVDRLLPHSVPGRGDVLAALDSAQRVVFRDESDVTTGVAVLDDFVESVRAIVGGQDFPSSFASRDHWRRTLDIAYDWLRLGGYLDSALPLDEARDLLESGGIQPHLRNEGAQ